MVNCAGLGNPGVVWSSRWLTLLSIGILIEPARMTAIQIDFLRGGSGLDPFVESVPCNVESVLVANHLS